MTSHVSASVGTWRQGSTNALAGSGTKSMSLSLIAWNPRIDEPSNPTPSANTASVSSLSGSEKCCQVPGRSVNRTSTICTPASFALRITSAGVGAVPAFAALALMVGSNVAVMGWLSPQGLLSLRRTHAPYHRRRPPAPARQRPGVRGGGGGGGKTAFGGG